MDKIAAKPTYQSVPDLPPKPDSSVYEYFL